MKINCAKFHHPFCWKKHWLNSSISARKFFKFHFKFNKKNPRIHEHFLNIFFSFWNMQNGIWKKIWLMRDTKHILNKRHTTYSFPVLPAPLVGTVWQYHYLHKQPQMSRSKHNKYEKLYQQLQPQQHRQTQEKKSRTKKKKLDVQFVCQCRIIWNCFEFFCLNINANCSCTVHIQHLQDCIVRYQQR